MPAEFPSFSFVDRFILTTVAHPMPHPDVRMNACTCSVALSRNDAADYLEPYKTVVPEFERWVKELSSGPCVVVEVRGEGVVPALRELAGPYDPVIAKHLRPSSLRAKYGVDTVKNLCFVTDIERDGPLECKFLFTVV